MIDSGAIYLNVDGVSRQNSNVDKMIWNVAETIETLSGFFELMPGDLIYSGTPAGVAAVERGALMEAGIDKLGTLAIRMV